MHISVARCKARHSDSRRLKCKAEKSSYNKKKLSSELYVPEKNVQSTVTIYHNILIF